MPANKPECLSVPERITVELTNRCNLNCTMCPRHYMTYAQGFMAPSLFKKIIDEMSTLGITTLVPFFRGEALLHPEFAPLMASAKDRGLTIQLATNGSILSRELAEKLVAMGLDFVSFSLDTLDLQAYRSQRQGELAHALDGLENLLKARGERNLPQIQVSAVDTGLTEEAKFQFINHFQSQSGVDRVRIYPQHTHGGRFGSLDRPGSAVRKPCLKPFREMVVYWDGKIAACNHDWDRKEPLGDLTQDGLMEVWLNHAYQDLRKQHINNTPAALCATCDHWRQFYEGPLGEVYEGQRT